MEKYQKHFLAFSSSKNVPDSISESKMDQLKNCNPTIRNNYDLEKKMPPVRVELTTPGLQDQCSATEL